MKKLKPISARFTGDNDFVQSTRNNHNVDESDKNNWDISISIDDGDNVLNTPYVTRTESDF